MIESVLNLPESIPDLEVLNPEIPKDFPADKSVVLDIRVRLHNGEQIVGRTGHANESMCWQRLKAEPEVTGSRRAYAPA